MKRTSPWYLFLLVGLLVATLLSDCGDPNATACTTTFSGIRQIGLPSSNTFVYGSALDSSCNLYITGFSNAAFAGSTLTGSTDMFVMKFDSTGTQQWTKMLGSAGQVIYGYGVTTGSDGSVYVTGFTTGPVADQVMVGNQDLLVVKYDSDGNRLWARISGVTTNDTFGYDIAVDADDNVYVTGQTWGNLDGNTLLGTEDGFLIKYDSSGTKLWTQTLGDTGASTYPAGVRVGPSGAIYVGGFTTGSLPGNTLTGSSDAFLAKYDSAGNRTWLKQLGETGVVTSGRALAVDKDENIFLSGITLGNLDGTLAGTQDLYIAKYDASGSKTWVRQLGTAGAGILMDFNTAGVDSTGNIYVAAFTNVGLNGNTLVGTGDVFVTKYDTSGVRQWTAENGAPAENSRPLSLSVTGAGDTFTVGITDGAFPGGSKIGASDGFILPFDSTGAAK